MGDSIKINAWIDHDLTDEEYEQCQYPTKDFADMDQTSADFRSQYPTSPLTGSLFKVTPLGMPIPGAGDRRKKYDRIAGYEVSVNVPACAIGHNRLLVNSVFQAARVTYWLLMYWLARNGCTQEGLDRIDFDKATIEDVTTTALYLFRTEKDARAALYEFRTHSETLLNKKGRNGSSGKFVAYSRPPEPVEPESEHIYTSYVRMREFKLKAYVKPLHQPNAFLLPLDDDALESKVREMSLRTLRVEVQVHGKWLKDNELSRVSDWKDKTKPYERVFGLLRATLKLDENFRSKRMKKTTVDGLKLCPLDRKLLAYHLRGEYVRDHEHFRNMTELHRSQLYSAIRVRVRDKEGIDFNVPYADTKLLSPGLSRLLAYPGEFEVNPLDPCDPLNGYIFSRISVPAVIAKLKAIVDAVLKHGPGRLPRVPERTVFNGKVKPKKGRSGIGNAPVIRENDND